MQSQMQSQSQPQQGAAGSGPYGDISTLIITYLANQAFDHGNRELYASAEEIVVEIASYIAVTRTNPAIKAIPHKDVAGYSAMINEICGIMMIIFDQLAEKEYIQVERDPFTQWVSRCRLNLESEYIKQFIASYSKSLKYITHPSFRIDETLPANSEEALSKMIAKMSLNVQEVETESGKRKAQEPAAAAAAAASPASDEVEPSIQVPSDRDPKIRYDVTKTSCTCPAFKFHPETSCKHIQTHFPGSASAGAGKKRVKIADEKKAPVPVPTSTPASRVKMVIPVQDEDDLEHLSMLYLLEDGTRICNCGEWSAELGCFHTNLCDNATGIYVSCIIQESDDDSLQPSAPIGAKKVEEKLEMDSMSFKNMGKEDTLLFYANYLGGMFPLDSTRADYYYFTPRTCLRAPYIHAYDDSRIEPGSNFCDEIKIDLSSMRSSYAETNAIEGVALVQSSSDPEFYYGVYEYADHSWSCTCPAFHFCKRCRHIEAMKERNSKKLKKEPMVEVPLKLSEEETWEVSPVPVIRLSPGTMTYEMYVGVLSADLPDGTPDYEHFNHQTIFYGAWNTPEHEDQIADFTVGNPNLDEEVEFDPLDYLEDGPGQKI
jgi:hypothetical protein